jgi:hypothetical protein
MKYIGKNRLKYPNQTDEFGSDSFLKNTKNRTKSNQSKIHLFGYQIYSKPIQTGPITPLASGALVKKPNVIK